MKQAVFAIFLGIFALLNGPAWADFAAGLQAYDGGDYAAAIENWRPLAVLGDADAQAALAGLYLTGTGVPQDHSKAAELYRAAAEQGHVQAQLNLGELYAEGRGVSRNRVKALKWLGLAAATGHSWAADAAERIAGTLSEEELQEARRLIVSWEPKQ